MTALYPFQQAAVDEIEGKIVEGHRRIILRPNRLRRDRDRERRHRPRSGKASARVGARASARDPQTGDKLATHGVLHGIIMAGVGPRPMASVLE
jgi:hypothetical protein